MQMVLLLGNMMAMAFGASVYAVADNSTRYLDIRIIKPDGSPLTNGACYVSWDTFDIVSSGAKTIQTALSAQVVPSSDKVKTIRIELMPKVDAPFYGKWTIKPREVPAEELKNGIKLVAKRCASIEGRVVDEAGNAVTNIKVHIEFSYPGGSLLGDDNAGNKPRTQAIQYEDYTKSYPSYVATDDQGLFRFGLICSTNAVGFYLWDRYMEGRVDNVLLSRQDGVVVIRGKKIAQQDVSFSLWTRDSNGKMERFVQYTGRCILNGDKLSGEYDLVDGKSKSRMFRHGNYRCILPDSLDIVVLNPDITIPDDGPDVRLIVKAPTEVMFRVMDRFSGEPLSGVGISLRMTASGENLSKNSDDSGVATFSIVDPQFPANIAVSHRDYLPYVQNDIRLVSENQILLAPGLHFYGTIKTSDGIPVTNAHVALIRKNSIIGERGASNMGEYRFTALESGKAQIVVIARGFARKVEAVTINEQASPHAITLEAGLQIIVDIDPTLREEFTKADPTGEIVIAEKGSFEIVSANPLSDAEAKGWVSPGVYDIYWVNGFMNKAVKIHTTEIRAAGRIKCPQNSLAECTIMKAPISFTIGGMPMR
jgi:hypothetical protein